MSNWYDKQKSALLELRNHVVNGDAVRHLKTKECIIKFEPVLTELSRWVNISELICVRKRHEETDYNDLTVSSYVALKWDGYISRFIVQRYVTVINECEDNSFDTEIVVSEDILNDMSERQLHDVFPLCDVLIRKVITLIDFELSENNARHLKGNN